MTVIASVLATGIVFHPSGIDTAGSDLVVPVPDGSILTQMLLLVAPE